MKIQYVILSNLLKNEAFMRKVSAFIQPDYFEDKTERSLFEKTIDYIQKYNTQPTAEVLKIEFQNDNLEPNAVQEAHNLVDALNTAPIDGKSLEWLLEKTEEFCKDRALYNGILKSIKIIDGKDAKETLSKNAIPDLLRKALAVSFDTAIGHDFLIDVEQRYEFYHNKAEQIAFDLEMMNVITEGGIPKKSLSVVAAETGGGKSIFLCHHAANCLRQGKNVLYITLEMSEERIAERIDANLMNINLGDLRELPFPMYAQKFKRATGGFKGKLIIKEYPTGSANALNFRHLMDELELKKEFVPDVLIVDYLNICSSARYKANANVNSYTMVKAIAEELRGLAVERNVQLWSATQLNRSGFKNTDVDLTNTAESMGLPHTTDFFIALITTDELEEMGQIMIKQLKNRYSDVANHRKFVVGLDKPKMKFYDVSPNGQLTNPSVTVQPTGKVTHNNPKPPVKTQPKTPHIDDDDDSTGGTGSFREKFQKWG